MVQLSHDTAAARRFLNSVRGIEYEISSLRRERERLLSRGLVSPVPSPVPPHRAPDAVGERLALWSDYGDEIELRERELIALKRAVHAAIEAVPEPVLRAILIERYLNYAKFEQIAALIHYDYYHVVKFLHPKALSYIQIPREFVCMSDIHTPRGV